MTTFKLPTLVSKMLHDNKKVYLKTNLIDGIWKARLETPKKSFWYDNTDIDAAVTGLGEEVFRYLMEDLLHEKKAEEER